MLNNYAIAAALAEEHRAELQRQAEQHRRILAARAGAGPRVHAAPVRRLSSWLMWMRPRRRATRPSPANLRCEGR